MIAIDVSSINVTQTFLLEHLTHGFSIVMLYTKHLLYYFIAFEIVLSGLGWALYQNQYAERLFFQIIKIGLILFIVENYTYILNSLLESILIIGHHVSGKNTEKILLNPGIIWQYGYNFALSLLQTAASSEGFALPMILTTLGFGTLLSVGIFGIQILLQVVAFYLVALVSLLSIPLSVFSPLKDFFSQSIKSILQAAIRLMVQIILVSAALSLWSQMKLQHFDISMGIATPLGFLFSGILFTFASAYLPRLAANVIGNIQTEKTASSVSSTASSATVQPYSQAAYSSFGQIQAVSSAAPTHIAAHITTASPAANINASTQVIHSDPSQIRTVFQSAMGKTQTTEQHTISENKEEIEKIKQAFYEVLTEIQEQNKNNKSSSDKS